MDDIANMLIQNSIFTTYAKQNRESTEGYSKSVVRKNNDKFGKMISLNKYNICKSQKEGPGVPCRHVTPVANVLCKPPQIR